MYLYAFANHEERIIDALSNKKSLLKKRVNRSDNFTNLTLLGVEKCLGDIELDKETNLYISSNDGNMNSTIKILDAIFKKNRLPMPFNFLNSVNASILFFVAKNFGIEGKAIFTDTFESALTQAYIDLSNGKTVLLGNVSEALADLELHKKKFHTDTIIEKSQWLLLSPKLNNREPIAQINTLTLRKSQKENNMKTLFQFLENKDLETTQSKKDFFGESLTFTLSKV